MSELATECPDGPSLIDVVTASCATYRQVDFWIRCGHIEVVTYGGHGYQTPRESGSGRLRRISAVEARVLHVMARLVKAGFAPKDAASMARVLVTEQVDTVDIEGGVRVSILSDADQL